MFLATQLHDKSGEWHELLPEDIDYIVEERISPTIDIKALVFYGKDGRKYVTTANVDEEFNEVGADTKLAVIESKLRIVD